MFLEAQVRRATVTSWTPADDERALSTKGRSKFGNKKYQGLAIASRREAVTLFVAELL